MAQRRMFSKVITNSARFLKMPVDSQSLYFHLGMAADDDGVVEAWSVLRSTGSGEDNLRVLASKGFVKVLNEDMVTYILDWNEHNAMRADRLTPSSYRELLVQVLPTVELVVPTQRADRTYRLGRPEDNHGTPQGRVGEERVGNTSELALAEEITLEEEEPRKPRTTPKYPHSKEVFKWFPHPEKSWELNTTELKHAELLWERGEEPVKKHLRYVVAHKDEEHFYQITKPSDLERKWEDIRAYAKRN